LEHNWVAHADRHGGRFRSFLLMAMKRFLAREWDKAKTLRRGGQVRLVPLQLDAAETRYGRELVDTRTPEELFERQWALTLLESVLSRLREDYARERLKEEIAHTVASPAEAEEEPQIRSEADSGCQRQY
jgi:hypothetical protein